MNRLGTAFVLALMVMAMSESGDGDMAVADESLSLWDINAAVESAQDAVHAAQNVFNEADAESKAYKTKRWRYLALFEGPEDRDSLAPLGKPPDAERVIAARKKLVDAQRTLTALQLEARERTEARKHRGTGDDPPVHSEKGEVFPSLWTGATAAICAATISATTSSHPSRRSVSTAGAVLLASVGLLPVAGAASASPQKPHWDCSSAGTSAVTKYRCAIPTEKEERNEVCSKMKAAAVSLCALHGQSSEECVAVTKPHRSICENGNSDWKLIQGDLALIQDAAHDSESAAVSLGATMKDGSVAVNKGGSGCTSSSTCATGEGDCDADSDCNSGLKCFQRDGDEEVPGVASMAGMPSGYDFCYDPENADADWERGCASGDEKRSSYGSECGLCFTPEEQQLLTDSQRDFMMSHHCGKYVEMKNSINADYSEDGIKKWIKTGLTHYNSQARGNVGWSRVLRSTKHGMTCLKKYGFGTTMSSNLLQAWTQVFFKSACIVPGTSPERFLSRKALVHCYEWPSAYSSDFNTCATHNPAAQCASIVDNWTPVTDLSTCDPHGFAMA